MSHVWLPCPAALAFLPGPGWTIRLSKRESYHIDWYLRPPDRTVVYRSFSSLRRALGLQPSAPLEWAAFDDGSIDVGADNDPEDPCVKLQVEVLKTWVQASAGKSTKPSIPACTRKPSAAAEAPEPPVDLQARSRRKAAQVDAREYVPSGYAPSGKRSKASEGRPSPDSAVSSRPKRSSAGRAVDRFSPEASDLGRWQKFRMEGLTPVLMTSEFDLHPPVGTPFQPFEPTPFPDDEFIQPAAKNDVCNEPSNSHCTLAQNENAKMLV
eukprot:TRINITY_DN27093_c0_g1_i1.p1 TRINITY_DN27093_c0_g1~~TRINITY_DN27093_c0_g1_i1.p1  ORF type:complete len:267 (+),score=17.25 TRINITY_DN27093_c0_g1_i1:139-939(+)